MPTHDETTAFQRDRARLIEEQAERLKARLADAALPVPCVVVCNTVP